MTDKALRLSRPQIRVLLEGFNHKIRRGGMNWFYHDGVNWSNPARFYNLATVRSLHKRGLLDANFDGLASSLWILEGRGGSNRITRFLFA